MGGSCSIWSSGQPINSLVNAILLANLHIYKDLTDKSLFIKDLVVSLLLSL